MSCKLYFCVFTEGVGLLLIVDVCSVLFLIMLYVSLIRMKEKTELNFIHFIVLILSRICNVQS